MTTSPLSTSASTSHGRPMLYVLAGGFIAGAFDITYAWVFWALKAGVSAQRIFQSVAAGWLGAADARAGGWATAALGLASHFFIAISMAVVYYLVARRWALLWQRPFLCGAGYGLLLYGAMNYVIVPLSRAGGGKSGPPNVLWIALSIVVHMLLIGVPIAYAARRAMAEVSPTRYE